MTDDLFPDCRQDSPRLAWMKRHGITVRPATTYERVCIYDAGDPDAADAYRFVAKAPTKPHGFIYGYAPTEDEAVAALGIPLWNEEQYAKEKTK